MTTVQWVTHKTKHPMGNQGAGFAHDGKGPAQGDQTDEIDYASEDDQTHDDQVERQVLAVLTGFRSIPPLV